MGTSLYPPLAKAEAIPKATAQQPVPTGSPLLHRLLAVGVVPSDDYDALSIPERQAIDREADDARLLDALVAARLLSEHQAGRVKIGRLHGMVLGNYRVIDRIGTGGMGVVYRGEHRQLRSPVAIKRCARPRA